MDMIIALVVEHWIISGWVVIIAALALTQHNDVIDHAVKNDPNDIYGKSVNVIVTVGVIWFLITLLFLVKWLWGVL